MAEMAAQPCAADPGQAGPAGRPAGPGQTEPDHPAGTGRAAQRRRTRKAIVEATSRLLAAGADPSVNDIAAAADVSRRTIYTYFPTLDQLLLDAAIGAMNVDVENVIDAAGAGDPRARIAALIAAISDGMAQTLPLGRKLIKLTVDAPAAEPGPKRGYRRIRWIEQAVEPIRPRLAPDRFDRLISQLAVIIGWEAFVVLFDVRGLDSDQARDILTTAAIALIDAALTQAGTTEAGTTEAGTTQAGTDSDSPN